MPVQSYLEESLVPLLQQGCCMIAERRPDDPVEDLANYLFHMDPKSPRNVIRFEEERRAKELADAEAAAEEGADRKSVKKKSSIKSAKSKKKK
ncbi:hypothetical protein KC19_VG080400 [Ceratodon purpureus]|uniref:Uncharacterized protein n=1 Tax=Ceratodon purpureus TaxID=3225 RepID=A0A8T0HNT4_CERPU|nr:hypothetical protein KC19_VG080400 [Ceratodon purpureus]